MVKEQDKRGNSGEAWLHMQPRMGSRIRIYVSCTCDNLTDRIELSNGTRVVDLQEAAVQNDGPAYEQGAIVPRKPWRPPTRNETEHLVANEPPTDMATSVAIVKLPGDFSPARRDDIRTGMPEKLEANLVHSLQTICEFGEPFHCIGPNRNPANLETVTFNDQMGRYNGLHVDSWNQLEVGSLHLATNRVCVNIGQGDRYLLFLPFSVSDVAALLVQDMGAGWQLPRRHTLIGRQFMQRFPEIVA